MSGNQNNQLDILKFITPKTKIIFLKRNNGFDQIENLEVLNYITNKAFHLGPEKKDQLIFFQNFNKKMLLVSFEKIENVLNEQNEKFIDTYASKSQSEVLLIGDISAKEESYIKSSTGGVIIRAN